MRDLSSPIASSSSSSMSSSFQRVNDTSTRLPSVTTSTSTLSRPSRSASSPTLVTISEVPCSSYEDDLLYDKSMEVNVDVQDDFGPFESEAELTEFLGWMESHEYRVAKRPRLPTIYEEPVVEKEMNEELANEREMYEQLSNDKEVYDEAPEMSMSDTDDEQSENSLPITPPLSRRPSSTIPLIYSSDADAPSSPTSTSGLGDFSKACELVNALDWTHRLIIPARVTGWLSKRPCSV
ncbi:hypothetical protein BCR39DRAFT_550188 [Naematelia encephala]|uniref:Uncharacterized protein n=1 Tax=Naematelia encephala TaxID=71784 RepID=A0A1Y2ALG1_9TREE|nr:hypothetical protein BCR39DRAFT_550188 [Naematelia encephala]